MLLLSGCAPQTLSLDQVKSIQRIALAGPENPVQYALVQGDVSSAISMGMAIGPGAAGGMIAGSMSGGGQARTLTEALAAQRLVLGDELASALAEELARNGYEIRRIAAHRRKSSALLDDYGSVASDADALLDLAIETSSYERRVWGKIGPSLTIQARLVDLRSARTLLQKTYRYDLAAATIGYTILRPQEKYGFDTPADVLARPDIAGGVASRYPHDCR